MPVYPQSGLRNDLRASKFSWGRTSPDPPWFAHHTWMQAKRVLWHRTSLACVAWQLKNCLDPYPTHMYMYLLTNLAMRKVFSWKPCLKVFLSLEDCFKAYLFQPHFTLIKCFVLPTHVYCWEQPTHCSLSHLSTVMELIITGRSCKSDEEVGC